VHQKGYILIVETDDLVRGLLERWLGEGGYAVAAWEMRELPKSRTRDGVPQLIIVDVPSPHGAEAFIESVKEVYPSPILLLSARFRRGLGASMDVANRLGVRKVLPKPFGRAELLAAVRESIKAAE
jgi:DNA-binding response OmpR family regulator